MLLWVSHVVHHCVAGSANVDFGSALQCSLQQHKTLVKGGLSQRLEGGFCTGFQLWTFTSLKTKGLRRQVPKRHVISLLGTQLIHTTYIHYLLDQFCWLVSCNFYWTAVLQCCSYTLKHLDLGCHCISPELVEESWGSRGQMPWLQHGRSRLSYLRFDVIHKW